MKNLNNYHSLKGNSKIFFTILLLLAFSTNLLSNTFDIGTGTSSNSATGTPTPLGAYYESQKVQYLYFANELTAAGMVNGTEIGQIGFYVDNPNSVATIQNYTIKTKLTTNSGLATSFETTGLSSNYGPTTEVVSVSSGWHLINLGNSFVWDGTSNLLIETCSFTQPWITNGNYSIRYSNVVGGAMEKHDDGFSQCGETSGAVSDKRANIRLVELQQAPEDLAIVGFTAPSPALYNSTQDFQVTVSNIGNSQVAANGIIEIDIDNDGTFDASTNISGLASGTTNTYLIPAQLPAIYGTQTAVAQVTLSNGTDVNSTNNSLTTTYDVVSNNDVGIISVTVNGFGGNTISPGGQMNVAVVIYNYGQTAADGDVDIDVDNDGISDGSVSFTGLAPNSYVNLAGTTTSPINIGNYDLCAYVNLASAIDENTSNNTSCVNYTVGQFCIDTFPYLENFDTWATGSNIDPITGWSQSGNPYLNWTVANGSTGSASTGPIQDYTEEITNGTVVGNYVYTESSGPSVGNEFGFLTPCFDLSTVNFPELNFYFHMHHNNQTNGEIHIDVLDLTTGINDLSVWSQTGQTQSGFNPDWEKITVSLAAYAGNEVQIRFRTIVGGPTAFENDTGIDQVYIGEAIADDIGIQTITYNQPIFENLPFDVFVKVQNYGQNDADFDVNFDTDGDGQIDVTSTFNGLLANTFTIVTVPVNNPPNVGNYTLDASVFLSSGVDQISFNDSLSVNYSIIQDNDISLTNVNATNGLLYPNDTLKVATTVLNQSSSIADVKLLIDFENDGINDDSTTINGILSTLNQSYTFEKVLTNLFSGIETVKVEAVLLSAIDPNLANNVKTDVYEVFPDCQSFYPSLESFDTWTEGNNFPISSLWTKSVSPQNSQLKWKVGKLGTQSQNTGPVSDVTAQIGTLDGNYLFVEASGGSAGDTAFLNSNCLDFSTLSSPTIKFYCHMFGGAMGDLYLDVLDSNDVPIANSIWSQIGEFQNSSSAPWEKVKLSLASFSGQTVKLRWRYIKNGFMGDAAIDHLEIIENVDDIGISNLNYFPNFQTGATESISVEVTNYGVFDADGVIEIDLDSDGTPDVTENFNGLGSGTSQIIPVNFSSLTTLGNYSATISLDLTNAVDVESNDNTRIIDYTVYPTNNSPTLLSQIPDLVLNEDFIQVIKFADLDTVFNDVDSFDSLTYEIISPNDIVEIVQNDNLIELIAKPNANGSQTISIQATDIFGETINSTSQLTINPVNDAPSSFDLVSPIDALLPAISFYSVDFIWENSIDVDNTNLDYTLKVFNQNFDATFTGITDTIFTLMDSLEEVTIYNWFVEVTDGEFTVSSSDTFEFETTIGASIQEEAQLPETFALKQNFPNPFNPTTKINFDLPISSKVKLEIFNLLGQKVRTLVDRKINAGFNSVTWNGKNDFGNQVSSGIYIYKIQTEDFTQSKKMVFLK
ncbi:MAG: T9SS C-terminal target domain-containing protein [Calditrichaeota bacterium]|nr:MAG: T9SS C-terminal target domain-containing protein [Calditrichota bacterium]